MQTRQSITPLVILLASGHATGQVGDMLVFSSGDARFRHEVTAADNLGRSYTHISGDLLALDAALSGGAYELAVIHNPSTTFPPQTIDALLHFIHDYRRVHLSYWNLDAEPALQNALGVAAATDFFEPRPIVDSAAHPSWGDAPSPIDPAPEPSPWNDNGDLLTPAPDGEPIAAFDTAAGPVASITFNNQRTIVNGFDYDSMDAAGVIALLEAQIDWVEDAPGYPPIGSQTLLFEADSERHLAQALDRAGIRADVTVADDIRLLTTLLYGSDISAAFISNSCCLFDARTPSALAVLISRGNVVHMSYWAVETDPVLQDAFGIATAADFTTPRSVHDSASHPSWGDAPSPIPPASSPSPWITIGAVLAPAPDASAIGAFDDPRGPSAIIGANTSRDRFRTIFNSFAYDAMEPGAVQQLLAAQVRWMLGLREPCYPDIDRDGSLTLFDFLAFQNAFASGDLRADCDRDGALTLFDFLCFQNAFDAGCP